MMKQEMLSNLGPVRQQPVVPNRMGNPQYDPTQRRVASSDNRMAVGGFGGKNGNNPNRSAYSNMKNGQAHKSGSSQHAKKDKTGGVNQSSNYPYGKGKNTMRMDEPNMSNFSVHDLLTVGNETQTSMKNAGRYPGDRRVGQPPRLSSK